MADTQTIWLDLSDNDSLQLKCLVQGPLDRQVAILVHGKPGKPDGLVNDATVNYFLDRSISCIRPFMYSPADQNTRKLENSTLQTYTQDFETVAAYARNNKPTKLFGIGHSYGALAILNSTIQLDAAVLLEPTHGSFWTEYPGLAHDPNKPLNEFEAMGDTTKLAAHKGYPIKIISAGKGKITKYHERYIAVADEPKSHSVIAGGRHNLGNSLEVLNQVRQQTADWLSLFM